MVHLTPIFGRIVIFCCGWNACCVPWEKADLELKEYLSEKVMLQITSGFTVTWKYLSSLIPLSVS